MEIKDKTAMPLWCGTPPAGESDPGQIPVITPYFPPAWKVNHRALVIFPGGGYHALAQYEGYGFAEFFAAQIYTSVLYEQVAHIHEKPREIFGFIEAHVRRTGHGIYAVTDFVNKLNILVKSKTMPVCGDIGRSGQDPGCGYVQRNTVNLFAVH